MNLSIITNAVRSIVQLIMKLNISFDGERQKLAALETQLNTLGNTGLYFLDEENFFVQDDDDPNKNEYFYLFFNGGKIFFQTSTWRRGWEEVNEKPLSELRLSEIDGLLDRLPAFLQNYQTFLEAYNNKAETTLARLDKVVSVVESALLEE